MTEPIYLDRKAAAKAAGVSVDLITAAIKTGSLRAKRTGVRVNAAGDKEPAGKYLISREALAEWYEQLESA